MATDHSQSGDDGMIGEVQHLWKCLECRKEFVTLDASEEETVTNAEIIEPFFTSLVVE